MMENSALYRLPEVKEKDKMNKDVDLKVII